MCGLYIYIYIYIHVYIYIILSLPVSSALLFHSDEEAKVGGDLSFGQPNSKYYTGDFTYVDLTADTYWKIKADG